MSRLLRCERGGAALWILFMLPVLALFLGLTWDAGNALALKREADNSAAAAARAGAQAVQQSSIYEHNVDGGDGRVAIDQTEARSRATQLAEAGGGSSVVISFQNASGGAVVSINGDAEVITVTLQRVYEARFLGSIGFGSLSVEGTGTARVRSSIQREVYDNSTYTFLDS